MEEQIYLVNKDEYSKFLADTDRSDSLSMADEVALDNLQSDITKLPKYLYNVTGNDSKLDIPDYLTLSNVLLYPRKGTRPQCPVEVPKTIAEDYNEACLVISDSPKASAALSRRCLQSLLRDVAKVSHDDLAKEIQQVLDRNELPSHIAEAIDAVRHIGNFGAHPLKSQTTGEILTVEPQEAEWNLEVLAMLFDFYYVQKPGFQKKKEALNKKLLDAGKKIMK